MSSLPNPMDFLASFQQALINGMPVVQIGTEYVKLEDECDGEKRYCYAKVVNGEVQALTTFRQERPINGIDCYSVNYSVSEKYRKQGLAVEIVNLGIEDLKKIFKFKTKTFFIDAFIEPTNVQSIKVAEKIFSCEGILRRDDFAEVPAIYYKKLITL